MRNPSGAIPRKTISSPVSRTGHSLLTGEQTTVTLHPAESGAGVVFRHAPTGTAIPADLDHVADTPHCTSLQAGEARIDFVEHLLGVLAANGVTDVLVEVDGGEVPLLDGSAAEYQEMVSEAGARGFGDAAEPIRLAEPIAVMDEEKGILALPGKAQFWYILDHPHPRIGRQAACFDPADDDFAKAVAPARTFATEEEARALIADRGLAGAEETMAVVAYADRLSAPEPFANSFAMHKVLDLMGDLYLLGRPLEGRIIACRTGHVENRALARRIAEAHCTG